MATKKKVPAKKVAAKKAASSKVSPDSIVKLHEEMKSIATSMDEDVRKFTDEEVAAAGRRVRAAAQSLRKICQQFRKDVIALVKANKGKKK